MDWNQIKDYMNSFIGIILLTLPFFFIPEIKRSKVYKWFFVLATLFLLWLGTDKMLRDEKVKLDNSKSADSVRKADLKTMLDSVNSQLKPFKLHLNDKKQIITNSYLNETKTPLVELCSMKVYKRKYGAVVDTFYYAISFCNSSNADVYDLTVTIWTYRVFNGVVKANSILPVFKKMSIPKNKNLIYYNNAIIEHNSKLGDTAYLYAKGSYDNEKAGIDDIIYWNFKADTVAFTGTMWHHNILDAINKSHLIK